MATHSSIFAWKIPWTEEPGSYSLWSRKEVDRTEVTQHAGILREGEKVLIHSSGTVVVWLSYGPLEHKSLCCSPGHVSHSGICAPFFFLPYPLVQLRLVYYCFLLLSV